MRMLLACCALMGLPVPAAPAADALAMSAGIWKARVLVCEPILVRVALANTGDRAVSVVPPYIRADFVHTAYPLRLVVEGAGRDWSEPRLRVATSYWVCAWGSSTSADLVRRPWVLPAGGAASMWYSLNMVYDVRQPGRYHLRLLYSSTPDMLPERQAEAAPADLWCGELEADLGWIEILEPPETERDAAAYLGEHSAACAPSPLFDPYAVSEAVAAKWPGSVYLPYTEYYAMWAEARTGLSHVAHKANGLEELRARAAAFGERYPDFPLAAQLDTIVACYAHGLAHDTAYPIEGNLQPPSSGQLVALLEAGRQLRATARASGDWGVAAEMALVADRLEQIHRADIGAAVPGWRPQWE